MPFPLQLDPPYIPKASIQPLELIPNDDSGLPICPILFPADIQYLSAKSQDDN